MPRSSLRTVPVIFAIALAAWACGDDETPQSPTAPTTPAPTTFTETFSGTLTVNGAATFPFSSLAGSATATLTSLGPDSTLAIGMSLGTWSGTTCQIVLANDAAVQGSVIVGTVSTASSLCVRVYDVGNLVESLPFVVTVVHP